MFCTSRLSMVLLFMWMCMYIFRLSLQVQCIVTLCQSRHFYHHRAIVVPCTLGQQNSSVHQLQFRYPPLIHALEKHPGP